MNRLGCCQLIFGSCVWSTPQHLNTSIQFTVGDSPPLPELMHLFADGVDSSVGVGSLHDMVEKVGGRCLKGQSCYLSAG